MTVVQAPNKNPVELKVNNHQASQAQTVVLRIMGSFVTWVMWPARV